MPGEIASCDTGSPIGVADPDVVFAASVGEGAPSQANAANSRATALSHTTVRDPRTDRRAALNGPCQRDQGAVT